MMRNGFHLIRAVFFALLILFNFLTLASAAWLVNASRQADLPVTATSVLVVLESCALPICIALAFMESFSPELRTSLIALECVWTLIVASSQFVLAISSTVNGPSWFCQSSMGTSLCASSALLVPAIWMKTLISFAYFFTFVITVLVHRSAVPEIWSETVYTVNWFGIDRAPPLVVNLSKRESYWAEDASIKSQLRDPELHQRRTTPAPWAQPVKRGVESPFALTSTRTTPATSPAFTSTTLKNLPPIPTSISSPRSAFSPSRFVERFRDSRASVQYGAHVTSGDDMFPSSVVDHDKPIPKPTGTEWVRASPVKPALSL